MACGSGTSYVTPAGLGLGNVDNTADADKPISNLTQDALDAKLDIVRYEDETSNMDNTSDLDKPISTDTQTELTDIRRSITRTSLGIDRVDNIYDIDKVVSVPTQIELNKKLNTADYTPATAENLGLGDVDNTADIDKPISIAAQREIDINTLLPGLPVTDVSMAFVPSFKTTVLNDANEVLSLSDSISGVTLTQPDNTVLPMLNVGDNGIPYLRFDDDYLSSADVSMFGGPNGDTMTFIMIANIDVAVNKTAFDWATINRDHEFRALLPWGDHQYFVYYDDTSIIGRLYIPNGPESTGEITSLLYERNVSTAELWVNGVSIGTNSGLTSTISNQLGDFTLAAGNDGNYVADMDFYALLFYPRVLTDDEKGKLFTYINEVYQSPKAEITAESIGLGNVDNTADLDKPISIATQKEIDINTILPGLPVTDVSMAFVPSFKTTVLNNTNEVLALSDPISGVTLTQPDNTALPVLNVDDKGIPYLRFDDDYLFAEDVSMFGGPNGYTMTFVMIANIDVDANKTAFDWATLNRDHKLTALLPWSSNQYYVYYDTSSTTGRLTATGPESTGEVTSCLYERNGSNSELWVNGVSIGTQGWLSSTISNQLGTFTLAATGSDGNYTADMDFYALLFYPRALTDDEKGKLFTYNK